MNVEAFLPLLLILPLAGFLFTALVGRRLGKQAHWVPVGVIFIAWLMADRAMPPPSHRTHSGRTRARSSSWAT